MDAIEGKLLTHWLAGIGSAKQSMLSNVKIEGADCSAPPGQCYQTAHAGDLVRHELSVRCGAIKAGVVKIVLPKNWWQSLGEKQCYRTGDDLSNAAAFCSSSRHS